MTCTKRCGTESLLSGEKFVEVETTIKFQQTCKFAFLIIETYFNTASTQGNKMIFIIPAFI